MSNAIKSNKNQTAIERSQAKLLEGMRQSKHFCAAESCPAPGEKILLKDLLPVKHASIKGSKIVFYHRNCFGK